ncbi:hypothetical protein V8C86DRAFT_2710162 [Haematococcus lacustris]
MEGVALGKGKRGQSAARTGGGWPETASRSSTACLKSTTRSCTYSLSCKPGSRTGSSTAAETWQPMPASIWSTPLISSHPKLIPAPTLTQLYKPALRLLSGSKRRSSNSRDSNRSGSSSRPLLASTRSTHPSLLVTLRRVTQPRCPVLHPSTPPGHRHLTPRLFRALTLTARRVGTCRFACGCRNGPHRTRMTRRWRRTRRAGR